MVLNGGYWRLTEMVVLHSIILLWSNGNQALLFPLRIISGGACGSRPRFMLLVGVFLCLEAREDFLTEEIVAR